MSYPASFFSTSRTIQTPGPRPQTRAAPEPTMVCPLDDVQAWCERHFPQWQPADCGAAVFRPVPLRAVAAPVPRCLYAGPVQARGRAVPAAPDMKILEAAQGGDLGAMRALLERHERMQAYCDALPRVDSRYDLRARMASACDQLHYRLADAPPVVLIGERYGCTATIDTIDQAVAALESRGIRRARLLLEYSPQLDGLLRALEQAARHVRHCFAWHDGLVDALTEALVPLARQHWTAQGRQADERQAAKLAREWAPHALAMVRARDAGLEVTPIDMEGVHGNARRELHMREQLVRHGGEALIVLTGGLHTSALLPAVGHGNFVAVTYGGAGDAAHNAEMAHRAVHQGLPADRRYHQLILSEAVLDGDPAYEG